MIFVESPLCYRRSRSGHTVHGAAANFQIDFLVQRENKQEVVTGKIIRSGYTPHNYMAMNLSHSSRWTQCGAGALARERPKVYHPSEREGTPSAAKSAKRDG